MALNFSFRILLPESLYLKIKNVKGVVKLGGSKSSGSSNEKQVFKLNVCGQNKKGKRRVTIIPAEFNEEMKKL